MPDSKITALTSISTSTDPANDPLVIVDVSDTSMAATGTTKKVTLNQLLGASGTATLASATITGDLTVDTSTLKVDSANNRVGVGTASPAVPLDVVGAATITGNLTVQTNKLFVNAGGAAVGTTSIFADFQVQRSTNARLEIDSAAASLSYQVLDNARTGYLQHNVYASQHLWFNGVTEAMRLNSTGLGVGVTPSGGNRLMIQNTTDCTVVFKSSAANVNSAIDYVSNYGNYTIRKSGTAVWDYGVINDSSATPAFKFSNGTDRLVIDSSGNVGIGVTPSAWGANYKAFQIGAQSCLYNALGYITSLNTNAYENSSGQIVRIANGEGTRYVQAGGSHQWFYASNASAGTVGGFTQAMTLDASGNLLVGKTAASVTTVGFQTLANGEASVAMAASTSASSTLNVWSTGAAAFRFYVAMNGTISATNTTISAISDARLKENVQDIDVGLGAILALKPRKFDWKEGKGKNIKGDRGFIAQEFEQVFPNLIDEWKDPAPEGEAPYKSVRQDLIPVLVKAIQELTARVQTLETR